MTLILALLLAVAPFPPLGPAAGPPPPPTFLQQGNCYVDPNGTWISTTPQTQVGIGWQHGTELGLAEGIWQYVGPQGTYRATLTQLTSPLDGLGQPYVNVPQDWEPIYTPCGGGMVKT